MSQHTHKHYEYKKALRKQRRITPSLKDSLENTKYEMMVDVDYNPASDFIIENNVPIVTPRFTVRDQKMRCSAMQLLDILASGMRFTFIYESDYVRAHEELYAYLDGLWHYYGDQLVDVCDHVHLVVEYLEKTKARRDNIIIRHPEVVTSLTAAAKNKVKREKVFSSVKKIVIELNLGSVEKMDNTTLDEKADELEKGKSVGRDTASGQFAKKKTEDPTLSDAKRILSLFGV